MSGGQKISVAGVQLLHQEGCRDANIQRALDMIGSSPGYDLYVLPELACSGYGPDAFKQIHSLAEDPDGPSFQAFSALAGKQGCTICYSFPRRTQNGKPTICAAVVDPNGHMVALYDKWHVCATGDPCEMTYFSPGNAPLATFAVNGIRVGICICYDIRFPEIVRKLAVEEKISLLLHPGAWSRDPTFGTWHSFVTTRAMENAIYIMSVNRAGPDNGCSLFCPPFVDTGANRPTIIEDQDGEGLLVGEVDSDCLARIRSGYPLLAGRRPELYGTSALN